MEEGRRKKKRQTKKEGQEIQEYIKKRRNYNKHRQTNLIKTEKQQDNVINPT